jgi:ubiquinone/menaquinone biosynthesis C-methylase UbiE
VSDQQYDPDTIKRGIEGVFDRGADTYDQVGVDFFSPAARDLVAKAGLRAGERVLDLGTGRGAVLFAAAEAVGPDGRAVGIDLSSRMAELTAAEAAARNLRHVTVAQGDAEQPDFAPGSFDAILLGFAIFMLPDAASVLPRYRELLSPGGRLCFTTFGVQDPNFDAGMDAFAEYVPGNLPHRNARQGPFGSREGITEFLTTGGFADVEIDEITYASRFADADHWVSWVWSHGGRFTVERIPEDVLDEATAAAKAAFEPARSPSGDYVINTEIRFTVGRRP